MDEIKSIDPIEQYNNSSQQITVYNLERYGRKVCIVLGAQNEDLAHKIEAIINNPKLANNVNNMLNVLEAIINARKAKDKIHNLKTKKNISESWAALRTFNEALDKAEGLIKEITNI